MQSYIRSLEVLLENAATTRERVDAMNTLAWAIQQIDTSRMEKLSREAYQLAQDEAYTSGMAESTANVGRLFYLRAYYENALQYAQQALEILQKDNAMQCKAHALNTVGCVHRRLGNYADALDSHQQELAVARESGDLRLQSAALNGIGAVHCMSGNAPLAMNYYEEALLLSQSLQDYDAEAAILQNMCETARKSGDYERADTYMRQALERAQRTANPYIRIFIQHDVVLSNIRAQQYDEALQYLQQNHELSQQHGYRLLEAQALMMMGHVFHLIGQPDSALEKLHQCLHLADQLDEKDTRYQVHDYLSQVYEQLGKSDLALHHYKLFHCIREEVLSIERDDRLKQLEIRYRTQQARQEAETQKHLREQDRQYFERLSLMKDDFVRTASHDLKNPLASISITTDLLAQYASIQDPKCAELIQRIKIDITRMQNLIGNLLDLARLETGRALEIETRSLTAIVQEAVYAFELVARSKSIALSFDAPIHTYATKVDPQRIHQVLHNLVSNAIKYTPEHGRVAVFMTDGDDTVQVHVQDTGIGISKDDISHIFERFYRVRQERSVNQEGTGLGLTIARSIVEQHGGKIWVTSEPDQGSTFTFSLPLEPVRA